MMKGIYVTIYMILFLIGVSYCVEQYYDGAMSEFVSGFCMSVAVFMNVISIILVRFQLKIRERKEGTF
ncbi:hypothetical protein [Bacillus sp. S10(2024)]|uniref:hypothetical protein n=2 Tax=unclassified Bacillus (in: firmicutes) TaxID=185979 RepID=UPI003D2339A0|nr:hypothetical protein [Bacillus sp. BP-3]